jgi:hypothetical protein
VRTREGSEEQVEEQVGGSDDGRVSGEEGDRNTEAEGATEKQKPQDG